MSKLNKGLEDWLKIRTRDFIDDALHFMISRQKEDPEQVAEMLVRTFYDALFESIVKAEAFAGRLPLGASSQNIRNLEFAHEKIVHRIVEQAVRGIQPGSKYLWTVWISKRQKPL